MEYAWKIGGKGIYLNKTRINMSYQMWRASKSTLQVQTTKTLRFINLHQHAQSASQNTHGMVKEFLTNHSHTPAYTWSTRRINPKITRRRSYSLRSSSPITHAAVPPCRVPEMEKAYINRIIFPCTVQICNQFHLTLPRFSRSKQNII